MNYLKKNNFHAIFNFSHKENLNLPFKAIRIDHFLTTDILDQLTYELKDVNFGSLFLTMGGRNLVSNEEKKFFKIKKQIKCLELIYNHMNTICFYEKISNELSLDLDTKKYFFNKNAALAKESLIQKIKRKLISLFYKQLFLRIDISLSKEGYKREPHRDINERIIVFLLYLSDLNEDTGGVLQFFKSYDESYPRQPNEEMLELITELKPQKNMFVAFESSLNSYHGVSLLKKDERLFIYGGFSVN
ncbi:2OG-Fe(II) oxygenase [Alphaproteobacteria bacterium]|nr:2OG-Fe(II) oxygenase [Alphaproteobacteria bacterium]